MQDLIDYIHRNVPGTDPAIEADIRRTFRIQRVERGAHLIRAGEVCKKLYFVKKGMLRNYVIKEDKECTVWFFFPGDFLTVFDSLQLQTPGRESTLAMSPCELYWISIEQLEALNAGSHQWERISRIFTIQFALQRKRVIERKKALRRVAE